MQTRPGVIWSGNFDKKLQDLVTVFASEDMPKEIELPAPYVRSLFFDRDTVATLCHAAVTAEDAIIHLDDAGAFKEWQPTSILTGEEKELMFKTAHSPFFGPLLGLQNIAEDCAKLRSPDVLDLNVHLYSPLKENWSRLIRHLWDHPSRSLGDNDAFRHERYLIPHIFCTIAQDQADRSFARIIEDDSDLTIPLITRYWMHASGDADILQFSVFFLLLIPRRLVPGYQRSESLGPLYLVAEGEPDPTLWVLRRILRDKDTIAKFILANASHLRRFVHGFGARVVVNFLEKLWGWARSFRTDPLCSEFLTVFRTSVPLWRSLFEAATRTTEGRIDGAFESTLHDSMCTLVEYVACCRDTPSEAKAVTELWVSTGIFDALDTILGEGIDHGTEEDQGAICKQLSIIYRAISYGPDESASIAVLMRQQLPRPRTVRRLWDLSIKLSSSGNKKKAVPSHAARVVLMALEMLYTLHDGCKRRGCLQKATARCAKCRIGYCRAECQRQDWKDHKRVCCVSMEMEPAIRDEVYCFMGGKDLARVKAERGLN